MRDIAIETIFPIVYITFWSK